MSSQPHGHKGGAPPLVDRARDIEDLHRPLPSIEDQQQLTQDRLRDRDSERRDVGYSQTPAQHSSAGSIPIHQPVASMAGTTIHSPEALLANHRSAGLPGASASSNSAAPPLSGSTSSTVYGGPPLSSQHQLPNATSALDIGRQMPRPGSGLPPHSSGGGGGLGASGAGAGANHVPGLPQQQHSIFGPGGLQSLPSLPGPHGLVSGASQIPFVPHESGSHVPPQSHSHLLFRGSPQPQSYGGPQPPSQQQQHAQHQSQQQSQSQQQQQQSQQQQPILNVSHTILYLVAVFLPVFVFAAMMRFDPRSLVSRMSSLGFVLKLVSLSLRHVCIMYLLPINPSDGLQSYV